MKETYIQIFICTNCYVRKSYELPKGLKVEFFKKLKIECKNCGCTGYLI